MLRALKSIGQFAAIGALTAFLFGTIWWIKVLHGFNETPSEGEALKLWTIVIAPFVWSEMGSPDGFTVGLGPLVRSVLGNTVFFGFVGTVAVTLRGTVRFLRVRFRNQPSLRPEKVKA